MARLIDRAWVVWVGRLLMVAGTLFIGLRLWDFRERVGDQLGDWRVLLVTLLFSLIYAASGLLLALGWWLAAGSARTLPWATAWRIYARTQIAKYVPGNVFHLAGRHILAAREGVGHGTLLLAASIEVVMCLIAAGLIGLLGLPSLLEALELRGVPGLWGELAGIASAALVILALVLLRRRHVVWKSSAQTNWWKLLAAQLSYGTFFLVSSVLFLSLISLIEVTPGNAMEHWRIIFAGYATAWAVGFLIPGAPGGLGVRESVMVAILGSALDASQVLTAALLMRLLTTVGDAAFFLQPSLVPNQYNIRSIGQ